MSMDFFDWLPDQFIHEEPVTDLVGEFLDGNFGGVNWYDHYPDPSTVEDIPQRDGSFSTDGSYQSGGTNERPGSTNADDNGGKGKGRPRTAYTGGRDPASNRIQRRRTQNRNSQRIYRQRRIEERQRFEERAIAAEEATKQLRIHVSELHTTIAVLKHQLEQAKAENVSLRAAQS
ncbi:hypothetical protein BDZ45DRAFT_810360 [Acephala macrosclerotiorum]|nr:hypothetical protein BDZ45DRAFT_810360 [Acephala macrosclerotiorum]